MSEPHHTVVVNTGLRPRWLMEPAEWWIIECRTCGVRGEGFSTYARASQFAHAHRRIAGGTHLAARRARLTDA